MLLSEISAKEKAVNPYRGEKMICDCERTLAFDSPDHLCPYGTKIENSTNLHFIEKLNAIARHNGKNQFNVLDLGCSGGQFVKDCIDNGFEAAGLEGSDYSLKHQRACWGLNPKKPLHL